MGPFIYKVVFEGDVLPGFGQLDVQKKLAKLLAIDVSAAARLFMSKQLEIKRGITLDHAKKCVRAMAKLGALTYLLPCEESEMNELPDNSSSEFTGSGSFAALAFTEYFESMQKEHDVEEVEGAHELIDPEDRTLPGGYPANTDVNSVQCAQNIARQLLVSAGNNTDNDTDSFDSGDSPDRGDETLPGGQPVHTDVNKIREIQEITRKMLAQKKLYE